MVVVLVIAMVIVSFVLRLSVMTREYKLTHQAAQWYTFESWIRDKDFLCLYIRAEIIKGYPDISVYRRGPMSIGQYAYELSAFMSRLGFAMSAPDSGLF